MFLIVGLSEGRGLEGDSRRKENERERIIIIHKLRKLQVIISKE
jgi:hypothetical protein